MHFILLCKSPSFSRVPGNDLEKVTNELLLAVSHNRVHSVK